MSVELENHSQNKQDFQADCENCFGLCCVALPYARSSDFAFNKDGGTACRNLQTDYRCSIHTNLRNKGFKGCTVYECFGAGQKVSQMTYSGNSWRDNSELAEEMFRVFPIMQQLHEMLYYIKEALSIEEVRLLHKELKQVLVETEQLTEMSPNSIVRLDVSSHRAYVSELLSKVSEIVRANGKKHSQTKAMKIDRMSNLIGANLRDANLRGSNLRGAILIAADLRNADLRNCDFIGVDMRDTNLGGARLTGSIYLTQAQVNAAKGDRNTKLPGHLRFPQHWLD
ncbi:pentapeptide repeat-containing protein [Aquibacillus kalidii]|uniref:pentapeptide repeat-containing protein n=1 Tax=Aquibacillus kalidii TaxID=2762597 RepID=UPI001649332A|nr:pentapeptide repeat-containing protein [Aquibacillus kalidii]